MVTLVARDPDRDRLKRVGPKRRWTEATVKWLTKGQVMDEPSYRDIPGTFVFDAEHSRRGYHLNMFMMSLIKPENRDAFKADEDGYLDRFNLTDAQRRAVRERDWNGMLEAGGNVYYTLKLAATDGTPYEAAYAAMAGMDRGDFRQMMLSGGRPAKGSQYRSDWEGKA